MFKCVIFLYTVVLMFHVKAVVHNNLSTIGNILHVECSSGKDYFAKY